MPSFNCRTRTGGCTDTEAFPAAAAELLGLRFAWGSPGSASDRLRICCIDGDLPLASIAVCVKGRGKKEETYSVVLSPRYFVVGPPR